jgi:hypothetical protein
MDMTEVEYQELCQLVRPIGGNLQSLNDLFVRAIEKECLHQVIIVTCSGINDRAKFYEDVMVDAVGVTRWIPAHYLTDEVLIRVITVMQYSPSQVNAFVRDARRRGLHAKVFQYKRSRPVRWSEMTDEEVISFVHSRRDVLRIKELPERLLKILRWSGKEAVRDRILRILRDRRGEQSPRLAISSAEFERFAANFRNWSGSERGFMAEFPDLGRCIEAARKMKDVGKPERWNTILEIRAARNIVSPVSETFVNLPLREIAKEWAHRRKLDSNKQISPLYSSLRCRNEHFPDYCRILNREFPVELCQTVYTERLENFWIGFVNTLGTESLSSLRDDVGTEVFSALQAREGGSFLARVIARAQLEVDLDEAV